MEGLPDDDFAHGDGQDSENQEECAEDDGNRREEWFECVHGKGPELGVTEFLLQPGLAGDAPRNPLRAPASGRDLAVARLCLTTRPEGLGR